MEMMMTTIRMLEAVKRVRGKKAQQTNNHQAKTRMDLMKMTVKVQVISLMMMINLTKTRTMRITTEVLVICLVLQKCSRS
jgi:hypothetical protein